MEVVDTLLLEDTGCWRETAKLHLLGSHLLIRAPSGAALPKHPCPPAVLTGQATAAAAIPGHTGSTGICRRAEITVNCAGRALAIAGHNSTDQCREAP